MYQEPAYTLRVIWACIKKDIKSALTEAARVYVELHRVGAGVCRRFTLVRARGGAP